MKYEKTRYEKNRCVRKLRIFWIKNLRENWMGTVLLIPLAIVLGVLRLVFGK